LAREFFRNGLRVFATARSKDKISDLHELGIETLSLEVNDPESVERCKGELSVLTGGSLDYLVNNAGRSRYTEVLSYLHWLI
jgi:1-acylglycerone phosphate reductase